MSNKIIKIMKNQNATQTHSFWIFIVCFCSLNLYCQRDIANLLESNVSFNNKVQIAHYPLTAELHNSALQDQFLETYPYDVSGNAKHGKYEAISKSKSEGEGLYYPASPPFYPLFSRKKTKVVYAKFSPEGDAEFIANPGKKFLDPDNHLVEMTVNKDDGSAKKAALNKIIWDVNGDGKRNEITRTIKEYFSSAVIKKEKQLKVPFKSNKDTETYFSFPEPFSKNISGDFTVTFWLNPRLQNICNTTIPIIETRYFSIELAEGHFRLTRKENGTKVEEDVYTSFKIDTADPVKCHKLLENKWKFYGLSFESSNSNEKPRLTLLTMFKNEKPFSQITPLKAEFHKNIIPTKTDPTTIIPAKMMGVGFAGSLYSVRFFNKALNDRALFDIMGLDYKILRRKPHKNHYLTQGTQYNNSLDKNESNRFGHKKSARRLQANESIKINKFLPENYDASKGYTVSFWTRIDTDLTHNEFYPFNEVTDNRFQFFYGKTSANLYAGMQRVKDKLGVNRYFFDEKSQEISPIFAWLWEPGAFNKKGGCAEPPCTSVGWYHVVLVYYPGMMRIYLYHPDENEVYRRLLYLGAQNVSDVVEWGIGNPGNLPKMNYQYPLQSAQIMDDFKVYSWPLSLNDVKTVHKAEVDESFLVTQKYFGSGGLARSLSTGEIVGVATSGVIAVGAIGATGVAIYNRYGTPSPRVGYERIGGRRAINDRTENLELKEKKCQ